jgi:hypothetical protein
MFEIQQEQNKIARIEQQELQNKLANLYAGNNQMSSMSAGGQSNPITGAFTNYLKGFGDFGSSMANSNKKANVFDSFQDVAPNALQSIPKGFLSPYGLSWAKDPNAWKWGSNIYNFLTGGN